MPVEGGSATQTTRHGGAAPGESADGVFVYYVKGQSGGKLWRIPSTGGEETRIIKEPTGDLMLASYSR